MKWYRKWRANRRIQQAHRLLGELDATMLAAGFTRSQRRRVWSEIRRSGSGVVQEMLKDAAA